MIVLENIQMAYQDRIVFDHLNLTIKEHEFVGIVGPSGSGKSTLLRLIAGLLVPNQGTITINNKKLTTKSKKEVTKDIGYIFQDFSLFSNLTVKQNMSIVLNDEYKITQLLTQFDIMERSNAYPDELSGGQKQRLAIARALLLDPSILLIDEATASLDQKLKHEFMSLMVALNKQGKTIIFITHEEHLVDTYGLRRIEFDDLV